MRIRLALAALLAATAMPSLAQTTDVDRDEQRAASREARQAARAERDAPAWQGVRAEPESGIGIERAPQPEPVQSVEATAPISAPAPVANAEPARVERRWDGNGGQDGMRAERPERPAGEWRRNEPSTVQVTEVPAAPTVDRGFRRGDGDRGHRNWNGENRHDEGFRGNGHVDQDRHAGRDGAWRNDARHHQQRGVDNSWYSDGRYRDQNRGWGDDRYSSRDRGWDDGRNWGRDQDWNNRSWNGSRSWSRDWRRDQRYDWQRYRYANRSLYRARPYYAPYGWSYGYRRFSIGFSLSNILFDQRYWINDPYAYRLPQAYEPYRWVRYYDDVLLVDLRSGQVVDVIHDFFW